MKKILVIIIALTYSITSPAISFAQSSYKVQTTGLAYDDDTAKNIRKAGEDFDEKVNKFLKEMAPLKPIGYSVIIQENEFGLSVTYTTTLVECDQKEAIDTLIRVGYVINGTIPKENEDRPATIKRKKTSEQVCSELELNNFEIVIKETIETEFKPKFWSDEFVHVSTDFITAKHQ